jgi:hypothetical protein
MTFDQCSDAFIAAKQAGWHSLEPASQWRNSLSTYVSPVFGKVSVASVDTALVIKVLKPCGRRSLKLRSESEVGSKRSLIGRKQLAIGTVRTPPVSADT